MEDTEYAPRARIHASSYAWAKRKTISSYSTCKVAIEHDVRLPSTYKYLFHDLEHAELRV